MLKTFLSKDRISDSTISSLNKSKRNRPKSDEKDSLSMRKKYMTKDGSYRINKHSMKVYSNLNAKNQLKSLRRITKR